VSPVIYAKKSFLSEDISQGRERKKERKEKKKKKAKM